MIPSDQPNLAVIAAASRAARTRYRKPDFRGLDADRRFVPEAFTQLFHTPLYAELSEAQRLRYNQLFGLRSNELFMLFEEGFTRRVIHKLTDACSKTEPVLGECLRLMLVEESAHHEMFLDFNRRLSPELYRDQRGYFARPSAMEEYLLSQLTGRPETWPFMLWLILLLEEFSTAFSRLLIARERADDLSPEYVRLHRLHMLDEARHVALDATLVERYLRGLADWRKVLNGRIFRTLVREILAPKRSGIRVLRRLATEFPDLRKRLPQMEDAVRSLSHDPGITPMLANAESLPITHALLDRYPAFAFLRSAQPVASVD